MRSYTVSNLRTVANGLAVEIPLFYNSEPLALRAVLSLRGAGNMSILKAYRNRERFFMRILRRDAKVFALRQIHSRRVHIAEDLHFEGNWWLDTGESFPEGDGLVTGVGSFVLSVTVADCLPIWIVDRKNLFYGVLHSGWKGTGIVIEALEIFKKRFGSLTENLRVVIGPGIGRCCYSVDSERYKTFKQNFGKDAVEEFHDKLYLDLQMANVEILMRYGVYDITVVQDCTYCNTRLSSFRREGVESFGTMIALVGMRENFII